MTDAQAKAIALAELTKGKYYVPWLACTWPRTAFVHVALSGAVMAHGRKDWTGRGDAVFDVTDFWSVRDERDLKLVAREEALKRL